MDDNRSQMLAVEGNSVFFYHRKIKQTPTLRGVDFCVQKGTIYGLLGPSGCGKTTLLGCIVGRLTPKAGSIRVYGRIPGENGFCIPGKGVGYMPQDLALYGEISTTETLTYFGRLFQMPYSKIAERISFLLDLLDLQDQKHSLVRNLSGGQQRRVSFAAALIHKPPLLILDEPTVGVDPLLRQTIWAHLNTLTRENHNTIIITTHYVEEARQADVVALMREGRLLAQMNPELLMRKHSASSLEEVFLKLCRKDVQANEFYYGIDNALLAARDPSTFSDIWVPREADLKKEKAVKPIMNGCHVKFSNGDPMDSLLVSEPSSTESVYETVKCVQKVKEAAIRMTALIGKGFIQTRRNVGFTAFQVFIPVSQVIIFCLCIGGVPFDLPMSVVNMETDPAGLGHKFLGKLSNRTFRQEHFTNLSTAIQRVKDGYSWGAVFIGPSFTECVVDRFLEAQDVTNETIDCSEIRIYLDNTNKLIGATIYTEFMLSFQKFAADALGETYSNPRLADPPIVLANPVYGVKDGSFNEFLAPGVILGITYIMAVGLTAISIISEKKSGLLDRAWVAGVSHGEVIFSILFNLFSVMLVQVALVLLFTFLAFDMPVLGPIIWVVIAVLITGVCGMCYGLLISAIFAEESLALLIALGSFTSNLLISGTIWPTEGMEHYLRYLSYCLPWTLITQSVRSTLSRGWTFTDHNIWGGYLITCTWAVIFIFFSWVLFKHRK